MFARSRATVYLLSESTLLDCFEVPLNYYHYCYYYWPLSMLLLLIIMTAMTCLSLIAIDAYDVFFALSKKRLAFLLTERQMEQKEMLQKMDACMNVKQWPVGPLMLVRVAAQTCDTDVPFVCALLVMS